MPLKFLLFILILEFSPAMALQITHVHHNPLVIYPDKDQSTEIIFTLSEMAVSELKIFDDRDILIRSIVNNDSQQGQNKFLWDGKDQLGRLVPSEAYKYTLTATNEGKEIEYDVSDITGNKPLHVKSIKWNADKKHFQYVLKKPARVLIRVGLDKHGPLLDTVSNWEPRNAGQKIESGQG